MDFQLVQDNQGNPYTNAFNYCSRLGPIGQRLKSAPQEDFFYVAMLRYVSCFPSCQEGFFNVE